MINYTGLLSFAIFSCAVHSEVSSDIEKIIVQGSKQNQTLISIPASISVIDRQTIEQSGISALRDLDDMLPNVSISQIGQIGGSYISIRGVESNPFVVNRAAVYVDGIPYREPDNINIRQAQQVEVFKGPQSALYGANADAGIIVINTKTPSSETKLNVFSELEAFHNGKTINAGINASGELFNDFFTSIEIEKQLGDSYIKNIGTTTDEQGAIDNLKIYSNSRYYLPADYGLINLNISVLKQDSRGLYEQEFAPLDTQLYNNTLSSAFNREIVIDDFELLHDAPKNTKDDEWGVGLSYQRYFSDLKLDAALAYRESDELGYGNDLDLTVTPFAAGGNKVERDFTNFEVRVSNEQDSGLSWFSGIALYKQNKAQNLFTLAGPVVFENYQPAPTQHNSLKNSAIFGLVKYKTRANINLQAGLRYEKSVANVSQQAGTLKLGNLQLDYVEAEAEKKGNIWLPQVAISWQPTAQQNLFASAAKGYLPGGYNLVAADKGDEIVQQYGPYNEEELWSYEMGYKLINNEQNLFLTTALFYIDAPSWQEISLLTAPDGTVLSTVLITSNAAITNQGAEMELQYNPSKQLTFRYSLGYVDAKYDNNEYSDSINYRDNKVKMIPEWDSSLTSTYQWNNGWYIKGQWRLIGETALTSDNKVFRPTTTIYNLAAGYKSDHWRARLFADNITNKRYAAGQAYENFILGFDTNYYAPLAPPRVIGLELSYTL